MKGSFRLLEGLFLRGSEFDENKKDFYPKDVSFSSGRNLSNICGGGDFNMGTDDSLSSNSSSKYEPLFLYQNHLFNS